MTDPTAPVGIDPAVSQLDVVPRAGIVDATVEAGLELRARSQWSYARSRFLRHRLAILGLVGLVVVFGAGALANVVAPYTFDQIDLLHVYNPPTTVGHH